MLSSVFVVVLSLSLSLSLLLCCCIGVAVVLGAVDGVIYVFYDLFSHTDGN